MAKSDKAIAVIEAIAQHNDYDLSLSRCDAECWLVRVERKRQVTIVGVM